MGNWLLLVFWRVCLMRLEQSSVLWYNRKSLCCVHALSDLSNVTVPRDHMTITAEWYILIVLVSCSSATFIFFFISLYIYFLLVWSMHTEVDTLSLSICKLSMCVFLVLQMHKSPRLEFAMWLLISYFLKISLCNFYTICLIRTWRWDV